MMSLGRSLMGRNIHHQVGPKHSVKMRSLKLKATIAAQKRWNKGADQATPTIPVPAESNEKTVSSGSRIMSIENISDTCTEMQEHRESCVGICRMVEEVGREGLASVLLFQCDVCDQKFYMKSSVKVKGSGNKKNRYAVNIGAVWGQMATGGGHSTLSETAAALELPSMSKKTFINIEAQIGGAWEALLAEEMVKAGQEEKYHKK